MRGKRFSYGKINAEKRLLCGTAELIHNIRFLKAQLNILRKKFLKLSITSPRIVVISLITFTICWRT